MITTPTLEGLKLAGKAVLKIVGGWRAAVFLAAAIGFAMTSHFHANKIESLEAQIKTAEIQAANARADLKIAQGEVTVKVVTKYVDKVRVIHDKAKVIREQVPVFVPAELPDLPGSFRVFYDAAVQGNVPDPAAIANAAPVPPEDVASTTADNAEIYKETSERLISLQEWVREQQKLAKDK